MKSRDSDRRHAEILASENAVDERYRKAYEREQSRPASIARTANNKWTGTGVSRRRPVEEGELVGRVALNAEHHLIGGDDFYIGTGHLSQDGLRVFSWAAPISKVFFRAGGTHPLYDSVIATRTMVRSTTLIVDVNDELTGTPDPEVDPFQPRKLAVPRAPRSVILPTKKPASTPTTAPVQNPTLGAHSVASVGGKAPFRTSASTPEASTVSVAYERTELTRSAASDLRAEDALRRALEAPRSGTLTSVLSTLQPDQFDLVSRPSTRSLIIQGHAGTGKTVIATHRAAWLVNEQSSESGRLEDEVMIVGPTEDYVRHVRPIVANLGVDTRRIQITTIDQLIMRVRGENIPQRGPEASDFRDVDVRLGMFVADAVRMLKSAGRMPAAGQTAVVAVFDALRANRGAESAITTDPEWNQYLRSLPPFSVAQGLRRHRELLGVIAWHVKKHPDVRATHMIVDESQDVTPLEWWFLDLLNATDRWTLIGDMNQRRSDWTNLSWANIAVDIGIADESGGFPIDTIARGYRSTEEIMRFANILLPKSDRGLESLRTGRDPALVRVTTARSLSAAAVDEASKLLAAHPDGTVAVLDMDPEVTRDELRRRGWQPEEGHARRWKKVSHRLFVAHPDAARGLEFDGVVVVEPASYPQNVGRNGLLYTSLTRANKQLSVVHYRALPGRLDDAARDIRKRHGGA